MRQLTLSATLEYYDVPQIITATDATGTRYLCTLYANEADGYQYLGVQISEPRLMAFIGGQLDLRDAYLHPEVSDALYTVSVAAEQLMAEGNIDGITSREMELKLTNVNRASLHELLLDYEDYLRVRGLEQWAYDDPRCVQTRAFCKAHLDSAVYREKIQDRSDEVIANVAITLIHQCDVLIRGLIEWKKRDFILRGGIKEEMYQARKEWQRRNGFNGRSGQSGRNGFNGSNGSNGQSGQ